MSIQFIASEHIFQLNAGDSSLILRIADENYLLTLYYGKALPFGSPFRGAFDGYDFRDYAASFSRSFRGVRQPMRTTRRRTRLRFSCATAPRRQI